MTIPCIKILSKYKSISYIEYEIFEFNNIKNHLKLFLINKKKNF